MNLFPIRLIIEADVRNQNSSSIQAEGVLFLKNNNGKSTIRTHDQSGTNTTIKLLKQIKLFSYPLLHL